MRWRSIASLRLQAGGLRNAQAGGIACRQNRLVFKVLDTAEEVQHLLGAENDGQCLWRLWARNDLVEIPIEAERDAVEESKRRDGHVHRTWRQLLLVRQIDLVGADILWTEQSGRFSEMPGELRNLQQIRILRVSRQVAHLHVFHHACSKRGHSELLDKRDAARGQQHHLA